MYTQPCLRKDFNPWGCHYLLRSCWWGVRWMHHPSRTHNRYWWRAHPNRHCARGFTIAVVIFYYFITLIISFTPPDKPARSLRSLVPHGGWENQGPEGSSGWLQNTQNQQVAELATKACAVDSPSPQPASLVNSMFPVTGFIGASFVLHSASIGATL